MYRAGNLTITSPEDNALTLRRPDSPTEGSDGAIYVTTSQIQDMAQYHEKGSARREPYGLWRVPPAR